MQACLGCGTTIHEAGRFCPACGAVVVEPQPPPEHEPAIAATATAAASGSEPRSSASLLGCTIGDFAIDAVIGGGSFGTVYRGRQLGLDRPIALKVPTYEIAADPVQAKRFAREARAAARIVHPGVVAIYGVGELEDGRPYLAMQLIDGEPLDRMLVDGPVSALRALRIARNIASALSDTHAADVVHRDLKPSNVMWRLDRNGDDRITLVDFGIAVCRPGNADATRLTTGGLIGTPHYMSPEQAHGEQVDARADLYALGCVMFELVTGDTPFDGAGFEVLLAHLNHPVPRASERNAAVPEAVDRIIARLMAKKPDDRPAHADALVAMIDDAIAELTGAGRDASRGDHGRPASAQPRAWSPRPEPPPRRPWLVAAVIGGMILSGAGAGLAVYRLRGGGEPAVDAPDSAEPVPGQLVSAAGVPLRLIPRDDGELIVRTLVPEVIHAHVPVHAFIEIKTKLGGQFSARQVVVTVEDPHHNASAQTAALHRAKPGNYTFRHTFTEPGAYVIRIFPSETETVSTLELEVVP
jgi:Protein kinase domain